MFKRFLILEFKSFFRGSSVGINLAMKILSIVGICFFVLWLAMMSFVAYYYVSEEMHQDPLKIISRFLIILWALDLSAKYLIQQIPTQNIKPFLSMNIPKNVVVNYTLIKTFLSPLSWLNSMFFLVFSGILLYNGYHVLNVFAWFFGISSLFYLNNFLNILFNDKEKAAIGVGVAIAGVSALAYYNIFPVLDYSENIFL